MKAALRQLQEHPWLGHAMLAIGVILLLYLVLVLRDAAEAERGIHAQQLATLEKLQQVQQEDQWKQRLVEVNSRLGQLQSRLWKAPTVGLAQAQVQDAVNLLARRFQQQEVRVRVGTLLPVDETGVSVLKTRLDFRFTQDRFLAFTDALINRDPPFIIESLEFRPRPNSWVTVEVLAHFKVSERGS